MATPEPSPLPIDDLLPQITASLARVPTLVLTAEPAAGKTTRVPGSLLDAGLTGGKSVVVLEPRRIAARAAAAFVARARGSSLGGEVGYRVRFEERGSAATRLWFVTEGVLTRALARDPFLEDVGAVVLDEFHERHLQGDLALAMLRELQRTVRPELRIVVMSATLDATATARYLGDCPVLSATGRAHPVQVDYLPRPDDRPLELQIAAAVKRALEHSTGDVLVFLPGAGEIRRAATALESLARASALLVLPLHGELPLEEQDRALRPADRRKVILATNVAETSLTVEGVTAVVDSGLHRVLRHDVRRGLDVLALESISRSSAEQRAGRAGRTGPGRCERLWTQAEHHRLPEHQAPEVRRVELSGAVLELLAWGQRDLTEFPWFEAPEPSVLQAALTQLRSLGAVDGHGVITPLGHELLARGTAPRLARMVVEGKRRGCEAEAALLAALCSEKDLLLERRTLHASRSIPRGFGTSDLLLRAELFAEVEDRRFDHEVCRRLELDATAVRAVARTRDALARGARRVGQVADEALLKCILAGFPDRVVLRRAPGSLDGLMVGGRSVKLMPASVVVDGDLFVAIDLEVRADRPVALVALASAIERSWLEELFPQAMDHRRVLDYDGGSERVVERRQLRYRDLVLEQTRAADPDPQAAGEVLAEVARKDPRRAMNLDRDTEHLLARLEWLAHVAPELGLPVPDDAFLGSLAAAMCAGKRSLREVREQSALEAIRQQLGGAALHLLNREAPERVEVPSGRHALITYAKGKDPAVAARLQEFFGLRRVPRIGGGKVAVVLELLAPNMRPVQVTKDLESFWSGAYPKVRTELMRRYPRHAWPEDPLTAAPQARPGRRR